jgi:hypothetical protein
MKTENKKAKILAAIETRGWFTCEIYWNEASELRAVGMIKQTERYFVGGNKKLVWAAA